MSRTQNTPVVYLCGPIAGQGEPARGGFQSCNRRTIEGLRARNYEVVPLPYPEPQSSGIGKAAEYAVLFIRLAATVAMIRQRSIFHMTGLLKSFVYVELALLLLARMRRCFTIYDIRAGSAERHFESRTSVYRWTFSKILRSADEVMAENKALVPFIKSIRGRDPVIFLNHLDTNKVPARRFDGQVSKVPVIAYAGSVRPEKGLETILEASRLLCDGACPVEVKIAGVGPEAFVGQLKDRYSTLAVSWLGPQTPAAVLNLFSTSQFFLFPTSHAGEGQSNTLTEAMACGCVPITSDHGFNRDVVGDCGVVLRPDADAGEYARALRTVWESGDWSTLSEDARRRIREKYSSKKIIAQLIDVYESREAAALD